MVGGKELVDLHTHSTASDGTLSPTQLCAEAARSGVSIVALCDHDTLNGLEEFLDACQKEGIVGIPGVEISCESGDRALHLVGLGVNVETNGALPLLLSRARRWREERNVEMVERLNKAGARVSMDELKKQARGNVITRPHFARVLVEKGYAQSLPEAFAKYLLPGTPGYVPKRKPSMAKAVEAIHASGGLAIVAHPTSILEPAGKKLIEFLEKLACGGIDGFEAWNPEVPLSVAHKIVRLAGKFGLFVSGGSDFHGENKVGRVLGRGAENCPITFRDVEKLANVLLKKMGGDHAK